MALLVGMALLNEFAFRAWLDSAYLRWYVEHGAVISLVFGLVTLAWGDIDKQTNLISAHPEDYAVASLSLLLLPLSALATMLEPGREQWRRIRALRRSAPDPAAEALKEHGIPVDLPSTQAPEPDDVPTGVPRIDLLLAVLFVLLFVLAFFAWLLVIAPVQYFVYVITGAPARAACASPARSYFYKREGSLLFYGKLAKWRDLPTGAIESGFSARPVTFTAAITAAALFAASTLVS
ncbi:MAG: hypothetical protein ACRDNR_11600 [Gaiellaceae bacterium]